MSPSCSEPKGGICPFGLRTDCTKSRSESCVAAIFGGPASLPVAVMPSPALPWQRWQPSFSKIVLPFCTCPADCDFASGKSASAEAMSRAIENVLQAMQGKSLTSISLARLRQHINQCGLALLDNVDSTPNCRPKILGIRDRPFGVHAHTLGDLGIVDAWVINRRADLGSVNSTAVPIGHNLHLHDLLMVCTVVVHDAQKGNAVMRRGPQDSRRIHQVAVTL